jgi:predicted DNA-binding transcriptional regulator AlpA
MLGTRTKAKTQHYRQGERRKRPTKALSTAATSTPHQRQGDRASADDAAPPPRLPIYVRFRDLVAAGIVRNWPTLIRLVDQQGFPPGRLLGPNTRVWTVDEVEAWIASRPTERKVIPNARNQHTAGERELDDTEVSP